MGTAMYDALEDMRSLIKDKWGITSIVGDTPEVKVIWERKVVGLGDYTRDTILLTPKRENVEYFGLYGSDFLHLIDITIEVRSYQNQEKMDNVNKEILRIIKENIRRTGFIDLMVRSTISQNDQLMNMFKHVINVRYRKDNP